MRLDIFTTGEALLVVTTAAVVAGALWWTGRRGLSVADAARVLIGATMPSPEWNRPHVARLLLAPPGSISTPDRHSPADHRRAIDELVAMLPTGSRDVGVEAARAAQRLLVTVEQCDREIASLARDANPAELDRLESQLAALQSSPQADGGERTELRQLVFHQLGLVRRMHARRDALSQRRAHLFHLMRGLWAQLCLVRTVEAAGPGSGTDAIERLRALCAEIITELESTGGGAEGQEAVGRP